MRCPSCKRDGIDPRAVVCKCGVHLPTLLARFLAPGTLLNHEKYRVEEVIGEGGFGVTYLARHTKLRQPVAVKEFYPQDRVERDRTTGEVSVRAVGRATRESAVESYRRTLQRFLREGQTLASLNHPNVVRVRDLFEEKGTAYIVMDYVAPARTLDDLLAASPDKRLPEPEVRGLVGQLVSALEAVHREGVCHLDIKPENVLVTPAGQAVLIDFGAARQGVSTRTTREYTDKYAPPEVPAKREVGPGSDIFELGMMTHELLTGELPPSGLSRLDLGLSAAKPDAWAPDKLPEPWRALVTQALRLRLDERPTSVRHWWERAWAAPPAEKREPAPAPVPRAPEKKPAPPAPRPAPAAHKPAPPPPAATSGPVRCPNCGRGDIPAAVTVCPGCGVHLPSALRYLLPPGTPLGAGTYEIKHALGMGGHYITYLARHTRSNIDFVVKEYFPRAHAVRAPGGEVSPQGITRPDLDRRVGEFLKSARDFARLRHASLVQIYDQLKERGTGYVVMDFVADRTLREELNAQRGRHLSPTRVTEIMGQLVAAVAEAHRTGFYHLNLRPENVILRADDGRPILTEFYMRTRREDDDTAESIASAYDAPEIFAGDVVGVQTDTYGLGVLLHELLTGTPPPPALTRVLDDTWEPFGLDAFWKNLVVSALRLKREERPKDVTEWWKRYGEPPAAPAKETAVAAGVAAQPAPAAPPRAAKKKTKKTPAPRGGRMDLTDRAILLFGMPIPGAFLGLILGALAGGVLGLFGAADTADVPGYVGRGAVVWLACGALIGAGAGLLGNLFRGAGLNMFLCALFGAAVALAFHTYGESYGPAFLWAWYEHVFGGLRNLLVFGVVVVKPVMLSLGAALGAVLGLAAGED